MRGLLAVARIVRRAVRGTLFAVRATAGWVLRRMLRLVRAARYEMAVLIKGERGVN
jgi:hypothetical protein